MLGTDGWQVCCKISFLGQNDLGCGLLRECKLLDLGAAQYMLSSIRQYVYRAFHVSPQHLQEGLPDHRPSLGLAAPGP
jgi:hypothetical protein